MKILHTADWHLGRMFKGISLLKEQKFVLNQFVKICEQYSPDVILIAGDIYDRSVPPAEAVTLFNEIMVQVVIERKIPVISIAGNHDSPERIDYAQNILQRQQFYIFGTFRLPIQKVVLKDQFGPVHFYCVPYIEPEQLNVLVDEREIKTHHEAAGYIIEKILETHPEKERAVYIGHNFVAGGITTESERQLSSVGGSDRIDAVVFEKFNYVALGHLHEPQEFLWGKVRYSGSIYKYSFSEAEHSKSVTMIEMNEKGKIKDELILLIPENDIHRVKGRIIDRKFILNDSGIQPKENDYLEVTLENEEPVANAMQIIQKKFPNTLSIQTLKTNMQQTQKARIENMYQLSETDLFQGFYKSIIGKELDEPKQKFLADAVKQAKKRFE